VSFRREKFIEFGGPDGVTADAAAMSSPNASMAQHADRLSLSAAFQGQDRHARHGQEPRRRPRRRRRAQVPVGTQIYEEDEETLIADMTHVGERVVICKGGKWRIRQRLFHDLGQSRAAPRQSRPGRDPTRVIVLRLKADRRRPGLIGLPTLENPRLLASVTAARPKIADYPFTTLYPGLGVVRRERARISCSPTFPASSRRAHEGHGLGDRFPAHVERCRALLHLIDATGEHAGRDYKDRAARTRRLWRGSSTPSRRSSPCRRSTPWARKHLKEATRALEAAMASAGPADRAERTAPLLLSAATGAGGPRRLAGAAGRHRRNIAASNRRPRRS